MHATAFLCLLLPVLVLSACTDPSTFPNGTASHFHHFSECGPGNQTIRVMDIRLPRQNGAPREKTATYPLDASLPIDLLMPISNSGSKIKNLLIDLAVYLWNPVENSDSCFWELQDTYGMTDDLNGCEMLNCPLTTGESPENRLMMDISYAASFIETGKLYQLMFTFKNGDKPGDVDASVFKAPIVGCTVFQTLLNGEQ